MRALNGSTGSILNTTGLQVISNEDTLDISRTFQTHAGVTSFEFGSDVGLKLNAPVLEFYGGATFNSTINCTSIYPSVEMSTSTAYASNVYIYDALRIKDPFSINYAILKGPSGSSSNINWILPSNVGSSGQALFVNGDGQWYWATTSTSSLNNVAFTNNGNTFSVLQFMTAGVSASGGLTADNLNITNGFTANGVTGTIGTLIAFTGISASQLTGVSGALYATSTTNTLDVISTVDGAGLRIAQSADPNSSSARVGSIRLGKSATPTSNVLLHGAAGVFNFYNGISNTYSSMLSISANTLTIGSSNVSGATFSGLAKFTAGISSAGATFFGSLISTAGATFSGTVPSRIYSGICGSGGITLANLFVAGGGATIISQNGALNLYKGSGTTPSSLNFDAPLIKLNFSDGDGVAQVLTLIPDTLQSSTQTFPSTTGTLLNTVTGVVSINGSSGVISNVARMNEGNTFTTRQVMNAGISAQSGMTLSGRFNFYSGICGAGGITLGSQINALVGISAGGITSDSGYRVTPNAINAQTSSYILTSGDNGKIITMNAGTGITLTVPTGLPVGYTTTVIRLGSGNVGISAALGVSINSFQSQVNIAGQHAAISLVSYSSDVFNLAGGLTG